MLYQCDPNYHSHCGPGRSDPQEQHEAAWNAWLLSDMPCMPSLHGAKSLGYQPFITNTPQLPLLDGLQRRTHHVDFLIPSEHPSSTSPVSISRTDDTKSYKIFCTSCDLKFRSKKAWERHERAFHEPEKRWQCPDCNACFHVETQFTRHHKINHSCQHCNHANKAKMELPRKVAWGCGFCIVSLTSWKDRCDHIAAHFEAGKVKDDWKFTNVVLGLLKMSTAWKLYITELHGPRPAKMPPFSWETTKVLCSELLRDLEYGQCPEEGAKSVMQKIYDLGTREHSADGVIGLCPNDSESV